jgi:hypothetical protein
MTDTAEAELPPEPTLDEVFSNDEVSQDVPRETPAEVDSKEEPKVDDSEPKTDEPESTVEESSTTEPEKIPLAALLDERDKRQKAEASAADLEKQLKELTKEPETERPSVFDDEEGAFASIDGSFDQKLLNERFNMSREFMGLLKDDYAERENVFMELAKDNPVLQKQLRESLNPAKFAYDTAVEHEQKQKLDEIGDPEEFREKLREEIRAELEAEMKGDEEKSPKREPITPSLASETSVGVSDTEVKADESLGDILGR